MHRHKAKRNCVYQAGDYLKCFSMKRLTPGKCFFFHSFECWTFSIRSVFLRVWPMIDNGKTNHQLRQINLIQTDAKRCTKYSFFHPVRCHFVVTSLSQLANQLLSTCSNKDIIFTRFNHERRILITLAAYILYKEQN